VFFTPFQIRKSLESLKSIHPFFAITFLVCKRAGLPVGRAVSTPIADYENKFLREFYDPSPQSKYFYRASRLSVHDRHWVPKDKYASSGLQSIRTRGHFAAAFIHERNTDLWGWRSNYIDILKDRLRYNAHHYRGRPIPTFDMAVWLTRNQNWPADTKPKQIIEAFFSNFRITREEQCLFERSAKEIENPAAMFQELPLGWAELSDILGLPLDAKPDKGGGLASLTLESVGPARKKITFEPADRVTLITGDNGLGKTFLLETAWWALTGEWAGVPALPQSSSKRPPKLIFQISVAKGAGPPASVVYDSKSQTWTKPSRRPTISGLIVYARVDGSFAVWDPIKRRHSAPVIQAYAQSEHVFSKEEVWDGSGTFIEGLIRDWVRWQSRPDEYAFKTLKRVLALMSPPDLGILQPGNPIRLPHDSREIPTLVHRYGEVPITHASAGVKRIIALAYLIVWAWNEHNVHARMSKIGPENRMIILIDEIEAHLHPKWQRSVLPAALDIREELSANLQVQMMVATHSPMVMASMEPFFDSNKDKLLHLTLTDSGDVELAEQTFIRHGSISAWLTSEVFALRHARSREAEGAIEQAKAVQMSKNPTKETVELISKELTRYLAVDDDFWPRWLYFAEKHGVKL
jgi:hypothetical protein